jgi:hypothetical protein
MGRALPAFAAGFGIFYVLAFQFNWPAVTYFPALNLWRWGLVNPTEMTGPPMYWYGWMIYSALTGLVLGGIALLLPARMLEKAWTVLCWAAPLGAIVALAYEGRHWFL